MSILGHFKYHIYEVKLEGNKEETQYKLTCIERTIRTMKDPITEETDMQFYPFDDLRVARDRFQAAVQYCIGKTSFTDVSLFEQQTGGF